jgi:hypothetical protein
MHKLGFKIIRLIVTSGSLYTKFFSLPSFAFQSFSCVSFASYLILVDRFLHRTVLLGDYWLIQFSLRCTCNYSFTSLLWCLDCKKLKGTANMFVDNMLVTVWHCCWCYVLCYSSGHLFHIYYIHTFSWWKFMILISEACREYFSRYWIILSKVNCEKMY